MLRKIQEAEAHDKRELQIGEAMSQANSSANESIHGDISMLSSFMHANSEIKNEEDSSDNLDMVEAIPILNENSSDNQL